MTREQLLVLYGHMLHAKQRCDDLLGPDQDSPAQQTVDLAFWALGAHALLQQIHHSLRTNAPFPPGLYERLERALA